MSKGLCFLGAWLFAAVALAGPASDLDYSKLLTKDLDQMRAMVQSKKEEASSALDEDDVDTATKSLKEALRLVFSRPDSDNMVSPLVQDIRPRLTDLDAFEKSVQDLVNEAIKGLNNSKLNVKTRATHLVLIENVLGELKPQVHTNADVKKIFVKVRDAKIEIPEDVSKEMRLRGMFKPSSPSEVAEKVIASKPAKK